MKKIITMITCATMLLVSCSTTESGALNGAYFGSIVGGAIGGITGGRYGHDVGTLVGMATGAAGGAAIGAANENDRQQRYEQRKHRDSREAARRYEQRRSQGGNDDIYGAQNNSDVQYGPVADNSGDDRIDFTPSDGKYPEAPAQAPSSSAQTNASDTIVSIPASAFEHAPALTAEPSVKIAKLVFDDESGDGVLMGKEKGRITFTLTNTCSKTLYDVVPILTATPNKYIFISPSAHIEALLPGQTIRYTAQVFAAANTKAGSAIVTIKVSHGTQPLDAQETINFPTAKYHK